MNVAVAKIGHNQPPELTPFELSKEAISSLFEEAKSWLDGDPIATQGQADMVQKLLRDIQAAEKEADARRTTENEPFDAGKAEVQARYAPLIANTKTTKGLTVLAIDACKKALAPWLIKIDEENRAKAEALRKEAEEKQHIAMEAMRQRNGDLEASAKAEELVREAKAAEADARRADNAKAQAKGEGRAVGLRDYYTPEIIDATAFARHVWMTHRPDMETFLAGMAAKLVASGIHTIPGITVHHERRAQ
jgi:hypothetical protein